MQLKVATMGSLKKGIDPYIRQKSCGISNTARNKSLPNN